MILKEKIILCFLKSFQGCFLFFWTKLFFFFFKYTPVSSCVCFRLHLPVTLHGNEGMSEPSLRFADWVVPLLCWQGSFENQD